MYFPYCLQTAGLFLREFVSSELDPLIGVWGIVCGSVLDHPIGLSSCVELLKRLYYEDLVVVLVGFVICGL